MIGTIRLKSCEDVQTIIMPSSSIGEINWSARVIETIRIYDVVVDWNSSLVHMGMTIDI